MHPFFTHFFIWHLFKTASVDNSQTTSFPFFFVPFFFFLMKWCIILNMSFLFLSTLAACLEEEWQIKPVCMQPCKQKEYSPWGDSCRSVWITLTWLRKCQILEAFNASLSLLNSVLWDSRYSPDFCCCFDKMCKMHFMTKPMYVLDCFTDRCLRELNQERFYRV